MTPAALAPPAPPGAPAAASPPGPAAVPDAVQRGLDRLVVAVMLLGFYYNWYRYPFQINASGTSPTYADTPTWLSLGKYLILAGLLGVTVLWRITRPPVRLQSPPLMAVFLYLTVLPVAAGLAVGRTALVECGIFFVVPLVLQGFSGWRVSARRLDRVLVWAVGIALAVEALQVGLFLATGRLPALGYANSISVRFGSFLDDPNGWGMLAIWLLFFSAFRWTGARRAVTVGGLFLTLVLSQSLTAVGAFVIVFTVFGALAVFSRAATFFRASAAALALVAVLGSVFLAYERQITAVYTLFMASKRGSIAQHAASLDLLRFVSPLTLLGIQPLDHGSEESGYANLLVNLGVLYVVAFAALGLWAMWRYFRLMRHPAAPRETRAFAAGALAFLLAVYAGTLTLPYMEAFPVNIFCALFLGLAAGGLLPEPVDPPPGRQA